jgi:micrococcal nuclease
MHMKHNVFIRLLAVILLATMLFISVVACNGADDNKDDGKETEQLEHVDYADKLKLDMTSSSLKQEATVHIFIDGDTTHFNVPTSVVPEGILKARYLAINTPESTGRIEPWGKAASNFTKEKLKDATSIILESDDDKWNADSTGGRYLVWVWYKTADMTEYRNLNLEILQNGLAIASNSAQNRYGETCMSAIKQAQAEKLHV